MKNIAKIILIRLLTLLARLALVRFNPHIIAITGSVGKTTTKDAVYAAISGRYRVRKNEKSYNSELGIPLTILGIPNAWRNPLLWARNIVESVLLIMFGWDYPRFLVLEVGADRPGDIRTVASWLRPEVVVVTRFPKVPVHVEYFLSPDDVTGEKQHLIKALRPGGTLVLNADDKRVLGSSALFMGDIVTYGFSESAHVRGTHATAVYGTGHEPCGSSVRAQFRGSSVPITLHGSVGEGVVYAALAASAVALSLGINLVEIAARLASLEPPKGRMRLLKGRGGSTIIDDTYNASPAAFEAALETLKGMRAKRKVALLADMMELGSHSVEAHKEVGKQAGGTLDLLAVVGVRSQDLRDAAVHSGLAESATHSFGGAAEAGEWMVSKLKPGDVVLVKGSQSMRMERAVEILMDEPANAGELLVRQEREWKRKL